MDPLALEFEGFIPAHAALRALSTSDGSGCVVRNHSMVAGSSENVSELSLRADMACE
jgi:hypothetical protein